MRVLFTTQPASGHFHPLVPLASALVAAGHEVAFACSPLFAPTVEATGFRCFPAGLAWLESEFFAAFPRFEELRRTVSLKEALAWVQEAVFAGETAERILPDLLALADDWPPDLIVREPMEFGGYLLAEKLGLPHTTVEVGSFRPFYWGDAGVARSLDRLRASGCRPIPDWHGCITISISPPRRHGIRMPMRPCRRPPMRCVRLSSTARATRRCRRGWRRSPRARRSTRPSGR